MASKLAGGEVVLDHGTFKADQPPFGAEAQVEDRSEKIRGRMAVGVHEPGAQWAISLPIKPDQTSILRRSGPPSLAKKGVEFAEYPYARFNTKLERVTYTDDEYERLLADRHWTRSDTDYLITPCHRLDPRWPVIPDRYAPVPPRPLEQLQRRQPPLCACARAGSLP